MIENVNPSFESLIKKLREVHEQNSANKQSIQDKQPDLTKIPLDPNWFKGVRVLDDKGDQVVINKNNETSSITIATGQEGADIVLFPPISFNSQYMTIPGEDMPISINYLYTFNFPSTINKDILPFIDYDNRFSVGGDLKLQAGFQWFNDYYDHDHYRVIVNGDTIWDGEDPPSIFTGLLSTAYPIINQYQVDNSFAKYVQTAFTASVLYFVVALSSNEVVTGQIVTWSVPNYDVIDAHNYKTWSGDVYGGNKVLSSDDFSFTATGTETVYVADVPTSNLNVIKTITFGADASQFALYGRAGVLGPQLFHIISNQILNVGFTFTRMNGYYSFMDVAQLNPFYIDFSTSDPTPVMPRDSILSPLEFIINPTGYPKKISDRLSNNIDNSITAPNPNGFPTWIMGETYDPYYVRLSKSTDSEQVWQVNFQYSGVVLAPGIFDHNDTRMVWDDIYTWSGSMWVRTSTSHLTIDLPLYFPASFDMNAKVKTLVRPPLRWKKTDKFISSPKV